MDGQLERVYVALGNDLEDGFKTLDWTLQKWKQIPISIVILHVTYNITSDFVYTPFGKMPASSVSDEKLEVLRTYEQKKLDKLLSKYIAFCGKIKAEIQKVEKSDEQIHKVIVDLISTHRITKLVVGTTFLKSQAWKSKSVIGGSFYIHKHKPEFCESFIICGGKLVSLKGKNEDVVIEDDQGATVPKRANFTKLIGKMFPENFTFTGRHSNRSSASSTNLEPLNAKQWEDYVQEIETYFEHLLSVNSHEEIVEEKNDDLQTSPIEISIQQQSDSSTNDAGKMEYMRSKMVEAQNIIQSKKEEAKANAERCAKAEWAIRLCNTRVEELESMINKEVADRLELTKSLDAEKEQLQEIISDVQESKNRLSSLLELQSELSNKLHISSLARSTAECRLEKAIVARAEMVREIEELRRQRDVLQRRIEFCKEKDAIGMVAKMNEVTCGYRQYTAEDIRLATDNFSESLRLKSGGDWTNVYRGRINQATVAIKMLSSDSTWSEEVFLAKVKQLNDIRHPHLVAMMGFCTEPKCVIYEYMHNGSLRDSLFSPHRSNRKRNRAVRWPDRIRIAHEVCSTLAFLHSAQPRPVVHGHLTTSNILLDRNLVAKVAGLGVIPQGQDCGLWKDVRAFGVLLAQILTGRNWAGLIEDGVALDGAALARVLDEKAGKWPLDLAQELGVLARKCLSSTELSLSKITEELDTVRKMADDLVARGVSEAADSEVADKDDSTEVPGIFLCPIFQDVMKNPHVAADGFSYELEAIEEWLKMGRETSPMTNLRLKHNFLTPNLTLRTLIQDWHTKNSTANT